MAALRYLAARPIGEGVIAQHVSLRLTIEGPTIRMIEGRAHSGKRLGRRDRHSWRCRLLEESRSAPLEDSRSTRAAVAILARSILLRTSTS